MSIKKRVITFIMIGILLLPWFVQSVQAEEKEYKTLNLEGALREENIEHDLSEYNENDKQTIVYVFRGNGCSFCRSFLTFLNSIVPEYGDYFRVVSYETWHDADNSMLMREVSSFLEAKAQGVPFIIIGDKYFLGYTASYDEDIKKAIMDQYNSKEKYDVIEELSKAKANGTFVYKEEFDNNDNNDNNGDTLSSVSCECKKDIFDFNLWNLIYTLGGVILIGSFVCILNNKNSHRIKRLEGEVQNLVAINRELRSEYIEKSRISKNPVSKKHDRERSD